MKNRDVFDILREEVTVPEVVQKKAAEAFAQIRREAQEEHCGSGAEEYYRSESDAEGYYRGESDAKEAAEYYGSGNGAEEAAEYYGNKSGAGDAAEEFCGNQPVLGGTTEEKSAYPVGKPRRRRLWAAVLAATLSLCTLAVGAAAYLRWSSGLESEFQVSESQKQQAEDSGLAGFPGMSATTGGVTVTAQQSIVDNYYAYLSFKVEGYAVEPGIQPEFASVNVTVDGEHVSSPGCGFWDGLTIGEDGRAAMPDGSELPVDDEGTLIFPYTQEDGSLEYRIILSSDMEKGLFLNKPVHVELRDLGYYGEKEEPVTEVEGSWSFDWMLQGDDSVYTAQLQEPLGDTGATVTGVEISPISLRVTYDFPRQEVTETGYHETQEMVDGELVQVSEPFEYTYYADPPQIMGVKMKDGTLLRLIATGGGQSGYVDGESDEYECLWGINRILDVEEMESLLFRNDETLDLTGEGISWGDMTEEDFYVVNIR